MDPRIWLKWAPKPAIDLLVSGFGLGLDPPIRSFRATCPLSSKNVCFRSLIYNSEICQRIPQTLSTRNFRAHLWNEFSITFALLCYTTLFSIVQCDIFPYRKGTLINYVVNDREKIKMQQGVGEGCAESEIS